MSKRSGTFRCLNFILENTCKMKIQKNNLFHFFFRSNYRTLVFAHKCQLSFLNANPSLGHPIGWAPRSYRGCLMVLRSIYGHLVRIFEGFFIPLGTVSATLFSDLKIMQSLKSIHLFFLWKSCHVDIKSLKWKKGKLYFLWPKIIFEICPGIWKITVFICSMK